jgi:hypothetical protein
MLELTFGHTCFVIASAERMYNLKGVLGCHPLARVWSAVEMISSRDRGPLEEREPGPDSLDIVWWVEEVHTDVGRW